MAKCRYCLLVVLVFGAVLSVKGRNALNIQSILEDIPAEDRPGFLRYALNQGYELAEGRQLQIYNRISHEMYKDMYKYYKRHHLITDVKDLKNTRDIICFPSGCIEVDDPGIHPY